MHKSLIKYLPWQATSVTIVMLLLFCSLAQAQTNHSPFDLKTAPKFWIDTLNKKYTHYTQADNFLVYHRTSRLLNRRSEMPIWVQMFKGRLYHFIVFADPETDKVEWKLGLRGVGHIITDKFFPERDGEFYSEFSYVCSKDGFYLLTVYQRASKRKLMTHVAVFQKERLSQNVEFGYK